MGHILKMKPVFKEMIWGGHKLKDTRSPATTRGSAGQSLPIKTVTVRLKTVSLPARHCHGFLNTTGNCSAI